MDFEDIYRENYPVVYGYLLSLCKDPHEAEELSAQTFFKAIQSIHRYDGKCKPSTWLCTIGRNLFLNELKRKKRHVPLDDAQPAEGDLEEDYIQKMLTRRMLQSAAALESPYREVFFLRLEGISFRQIGNVMEKSENWARVTYYRAKTKIREETEGDHG